MHDNSLDNSREAHGMKVAIIHDWLVTYAGAERVLEQMLLLYPDADIYSIVDFVPDDERDFLQGKRANTTYIQKLPWAKRFYRNYLPLMPLAIEQFDLSGYDLVISSSHAVAKGVITGPDQMHISYIHTPIRYAWDLQHQYLAESGLDKGIKSYFARRMLHKIRLWDLRTANGVDRFVANSRFISRRIWKVYRREAEVIYPPVDTHAFSFNPAKEDYYLTASRMVPYKKIDLIVEAFSDMKDKRLVVIGTGPDFDKISQRAGPNVELLGFQPAPVLLDYMQRARAFIFAAQEDFGITPVEAMACGTPVIAYGKGGVLETVVPPETDEPATGLFFANQESLSLRESVARFEENIEKFDPEACRQQALKFSAGRFRDAFSAFIQRCESEAMKEV